MQAGYGAKTLISEVSFAVEPAQIVAFLQQCRKDDRAEIGMGLPLRNIGHRIGVADEGCPLRPLNRWRAGSIAPTRVAVV